MTQNCGRRNYSFFTAGYLDNRHRQHTQDKHISCLLVILSKLPTYLPVPLETTD